jgi:predicted transcriptional regulator
MIDIKQQIIEQLFLPSELAAWFGYSSNDIRIQIKESLQEHKNNSKLDWTPILTKEYLKEHSKLSAKDLAEELGCCATTIRRFRQGKRKAISNKDIVWNDDIIGTIKKEEAGTYQIIEIIDRNNVKIKWIDNNNVELRRKDAALKGIKRRNKQLHVGNIYESNTCGYYKILEINSHNDIIIKYLQTGTERKARFDKIKSGELRDPYFPTILGVACKGSNGIQEWYGRWYGMIHRCHNPNHKQYIDYGARGIEVSEEWKCFEYYCRDLKMLANYGKDGYDSIDRIDNSKGYSMDNCRWANSDIQNHNQYRVGKDRKADIALYKSLVAEYGYPPPKY